MIKPEHIFDRDDAWSQLQTLSERDRPDMVVVLGRRRIGKSYVLSRFTRAAQGIYYQATRRTADEQLESLTTLVGSHFNDTALKQGAGFTSWEQLFAYLAQRTSSKRENLFLVLDEFTYLVDAEPALPSIIQHYWDHEWQDTPLTLVLSGSYMSAMKRLETSDQPLYGRRTSRLLFEPFTYHDAARFVPEYSSRDRLQSYGLFGNLPGNLALLNPDRSLASNAAQLLLNPASRLVDDAEHMLDAFLGEASVHYSILEAIAQGERTWSGITSRVGRSGGAISRPLHWLEEMGLVERYVPITAKRPKKTKRALYRLTDPYVAFWHREVAPLQRSGSIGLVDPESLWEDVLAPTLDNHMGDVFESACRDFIRNSAEARLGFKPMRVGQWWSPNNQDEVDVAAVSRDQALIVGECKWGTVTLGDLHVLERRSRQIAETLDTAGQTSHVLFTGRDTVERELATHASKHDNIHVITADELFID